MNRPLLQGLRISGLGLPSPLNEQSSLGISVNSIALRWRRNLKDAKASSVPRIYYLIKTKRYDVGIVTGKADVYKMLTTKGHSRRSHLSGRRSGDWEISTANRNGQTPRASEICFYDKVCAPNSWRRVCAAGKTEVIDSPLRVRSRPFWRCLPTTAQV